MRLSTMICGIALLSAATTASGVTQPALELSYAVDTRLCKEAQRLLRQDGFCRQNDAKAECFRYNDELTLSIGGVAVPAIENIAINQYAYTQLARSLLAEVPNTEIIYLGNFQGDRREYVLETWQVSSTQFNNLLSIPPGPITATMWSHTPAPNYPKDTNSEQLRSILASGHRLSTEWSPILPVKGGSYAVVRKCAGRWTYGGYYWCSRVTKVTLLRLKDNKPATSYCQFTSPKRK